jgi:hypothetical protein
MWRKLVLIGVLGIFCQGLMICRGVAVDGSEIVKANQSKARVLAFFEKQPLFFIENLGQIDERVSYYMNGKNGTIYFTREGIVYDLWSQKTPTTTRSHLSDPIAKTEPDVFERLSFTLKPVGAKSGFRIMAKEKLSGRVNYLIGNDSSKWTTDIPIYREILYQDIFEGIDLKIYGNNTQMEYDFVVNPGADPRTIKMVFEGIERLGIALEKGDLIIKTHSSELRHLKPLIYQEIEGKRHIIEGSFTLAENSFGFDVKVYNKNFPLIIDPITLSYSTYLGGNANDTGTGITVDQAGNAYITGYTYSSDFPTVNAYRPTKSPDYNPDVFVTKLNSNGSALVYSTYLGGGSTDWGNGIDVDKDGNVYVTGYTTSNDFPLWYPLYTYHGHQQDVFVTKIRDGGGSLVYSTLLEGNAMDIGTAIATDEGGYAFVTGYTRSSNFPTENSLQTYQGGTDVFVTELNSLGTRLVYSTYLGGTGDDVATGIDTYITEDKHYEYTYVTGYTNSSNFPTQNPLHTFKGDFDAFVTKIKLIASGITLAYSTYLGGSSEDRANGIVVDQIANAYVTGSTSSTDFPTHSPFQAYNKGQTDAFLTKINDATLDLGYSTYLGGSSSDGAMAVALDQVGNAYVTGSTNSSDFPILNQPPMNGGTWDVFVSKFFSDGSALGYSLGDLGGSYWDEGLDIAVDQAGNAYITGYTRSSNFPTKNALYPDPGGSGTSSAANDAFVVKLSEGDLPNLMYWQASQNGSFSITPKSNISWGDEVTVNYAYQNNGTADIPDGTRFYYRFFLSPDSSIGTSDYVWKTFYRERRLQPGYGSYGNFTKALPSSPPSGFPAEGTIYIGMFLDYDNRITESNESDNRNQGLGKDYDYVSGGAVIIEGIIFPSGTKYEYIATESMTLGGGVTIKGGATVTLQAPITKLKSGFHAEEGSTVKILQQTMTSKLAIGEPQNCFHEESNTTVKIGFTQNVLSTLNY